MLIITIISVLLALIFMLLWLRERRHASEVEIVAYGLRAEDENDENTKTNISQMESQYDDAIDKLQELGEIYQDDWGRWIWTKSGKQLGQE